MIHAYDQMENLEGKHYRFEIFCDERSKDERLDYQDEFQDILTNPRIVIDGVDKSHKMDLSKENTVSSCVVVMRAIIRGRM